MELTPEETKLILAHRKAERQVRAQTERAKNLLLMVVAWMDYKLANPDMGMDAFFLELNTLTKHRILEIASDAFEKSWSYNDA